MKGSAFKPSRLSLAIAIAVTSLSASQLQAEGNNFELEEVTVYAQKREQSIMEVPVSVSSYGSELMDAAQVRDLNDLQQLAPSLTINGSSGGMESIFAIRGIGTAGQNAGLEQSVGVFIDGVYRGRPASALSDYVGIDGIEVLKGPQGTLFGRNTSAGVISVRSRKPDQEFGGEVEVSAGSDGYLQTKALINGGLSENVAANLAITYQERDGMIEDTVSSEDYNDRDRYTLRGQLQWDINEDASLRLIADYTETDEVCCNATPLFYGPTAGAVAALGGDLQPNGSPTTYQGITGSYADPFDYKASVNPDTAEESVKDWGVSAELNWGVGETEITAIASYRVHDNYNYIDADFTNLQIVDRENVQDIDETSLELRWASTGSQTIDWTVGFFYYEQNIDYSTGLFFGDNSIDYANAITQGLFGGVNAGVNAAFPALAGDWFGADDYTISNSDYTAESMAVFGQGTWNINDQLSLTFGLRYSAEEKEADFHWEGDYAFGNIPLAILQGAHPLGGGLAAFQTGSPYDDFTSKYDDDNVSGTLSLNYLINDELSVYTRFAQGYKSGGINMDRSAAGQAPGAPTPNPDGTLFEPELVESFEIGFKSRLLDNTLQINGAVFYQELEDFQQNSFDGLNFSVRNAATVTGQGLELDYMFAPNEHWLFSGGITLQEVEYDEFKNASPTAWQDPNSFQDLSGEPVLFTSDTTLSGLISYTTPINDSLKVTAATTYSYSSEYFTGQDNDPITEQDAYWVFNLNLSIGAQDDSWQVALWGKNVTDEEIYNIAFDTTFQRGSYSAYVRDPMTWGLTGKLKF